MKKSILFSSVLLSTLFLTSCADVTQINECAVSTPYGFFSGIWHGFIAPFSFIFSLFIDDIAMYAVNNSGGWYDFGFVLGAGILTFSGSTYSKNK
jgi:hypothetical protein